MRINNTKKIRQKHRDALKKLNKILHHIERKFSCKNTWKDEW
jgi:hypothetical protein